MPMNSFDAAQIAICVIGIVANIVVLLVLVIKRELLKNSSKRYILQLAIADLAFLLNGIVETAHARLAQENYTTAGCKAKYFLFYVTYHSSILFVMAMAIDRYCAINHGFSDFALKIRSWRASAMVIAAVWLISAAFSLPVILYGESDFGICRLAFPLTKKVNSSKVKLYIRMSPFFDVVEVYSRLYHHGAWITSDGNKIPRPCKLEDHSAARDAYHLLEFTLMFLVPIAVIAVCYGLIFVHIIKSTMRTTGRRFDPRRRGPLLTCLALILVFIVCWTPHHVKILLYMAGGISSAGSFKEMVDYCVNFRLATTILVLVNSAINPFLYFIMINLPEQIRNMKRRIQGIIMPITSTSRLSDTGASAQERQSTVPNTGANTNRAYVSDVAAPVNHETKV